jgi:hypothetical protein
MGGAKNFAGQNPEPGATIYYLLKGAANGDVTITISDITGKVVREMKGTNNAGINRVQWNLRGNPPQLPPNLGETLESLGMAGAREQIAAMQREAAAGQPPPGGGGGGGEFGFFRRAMQGRPVEPGTYLVKLNAGGKTLTTKLVVEADSLNGK